MLHPQEIEPLVKVLSENKNGDSSLNRQKFSQVPGADQRSNFLNSALKSLLAPDPKYKGIKNSFLKC